MIRARATDFASWRDEARRLLGDDTPPDHVVWDDGVQSSLFLLPSAAPPAASVPSAATTAPSVADRTVRVPAAFVSKAQIAADNGDPGKYDLLYRVLWKLTHGHPQLLHDPIDPDTRRMHAMIREVREEEHRMHAFVRFRKCTTVVPPDDPTDHGAPEQWLAWYAPAHPVLARVAPFFARRYPDMSWTLVTPEAAAHWDCTTGRLTFGPGAPRDRAPAENELDDLFLTYYASVFNPARTNIQAMTRHLPLRIQAQLPERAAIRDLAVGSAARVRTMQAPVISASDAWVPPRFSASASASFSLAPSPSRSPSPSSLPVQVSREGLDELRTAAATCRACPIGHAATQTVFGHGPSSARLMIVGEQPGDEEDLAGVPFVGPAGRLLDTLLERAELSRAQVYITNAVKHFKWEPRGKRRIHSKPNRDEIGACRGWLMAEVKAVAPAMILCLGATAAQSFCGPQFRVQRDRGHPTPTPWAPWWMATFHPSALLRASDDAARADMERLFLLDLQTTRDHLRTLHDT